MCLPPEVVAYGGELIELKQFAPGICLFTNQFRKSNSKYDMSHILSEFAYLHLIKISSYEEF